MATRKMTMAQFLKRPWAVAKDETRTEVSLVEDENGMLVCGLTSDPNYIFRVKIPYFSLTEGK